MLLAVQTQHLLWSERILDREWSHCHGATVTLLRGPEFVPVTAIILGGLRITLLVVFLLTFFVILFTFFFFILYLYSNAKL